MKGTLEECNNKIRIETITFRLPSSLIEGLKKKL
jgi:hypothetical protein